MPSRRVGAPTVPAMSSRRQPHRPLHVLVVDGIRTGVPVTVAATAWARTRGLLGVADGDEVGALLLTPCSSVHSVGMRVDLDVAYLDRGGVVLDVAALARNRAHLPRRRARSVLEAAPRGPGALGRGARGAGGVRAGVRPAPGRVAGPGGRW